MEDTRGVANDAREGESQQRKNAEASARNATLQQKIAELNGSTAERNGRESKGKELAAYANESLDEDPERSIMLGIYAVDSTLRCKNPRFLQLKPYFTKQSCRLVCG